MRISSKKLSRSATKKRSDRSIELLTEACRLDEEAKALLGPKGRAALSSPAKRTKGGQESRLDIQGRVMAAALAGAEAGEKEELAAIRTALDRAMELRWEVVTLWDSIATFVAWNDEELQEGRLGLLDAAKRFVPAKGIKYQTYAKWWVIAKITRHRDYDRGVEIGSRTLELLRNLGKLEAMGVEDEAKICQYLGLQTMEELHKLKTSKFSLKPASLDALAEPNEESAGFELEDPIRIDPSDKVEAENLVLALDVLDRREHKVIHERYGLGGKEPLTLAETGRTLGLSRERVRQLEKSALQKIREALWVKEPWREKKGKPGRRLGSKNRPKKAVEPPGEVDELDDAEDSETSEASEQPQFCESVEEQVEAFEDPSEEPAEVFEAETSAPAAETSETSTPAAEVPEVEVEPPPAPRAPRGPEPNSELVTRDSVLQAMKDRSVEASEGVTSADVARWFGYRSQKFPADARVYVRCNNALKYWAFRGLLFERSRLYFLTPEPPPLPSPPSLDSGPLSPPTSPEVLELREALQIARDGLLQGNAEALKLRTDLEQARTRIVELEATIAGLEVLLSEQESTARQWRNLSSIARQLLAEKG